MEKYREGNIDNAAVHVTDNAFKKIPQKYINTTQSSAIL